MVIEFDHIRCGHNGVVVKQDVLGFRAERTVGFREYNNWDAPKTLALALANIDGQQEPQITHTG